MPKKQVKKQAKKIVQQRRDWTPAERKRFIRKFPNTSNSDLVEEFNRSLKSITGQASLLGLRKTAKHRSAQSRKRAAANPASKQDMRKLGSLGGQKGGPARAKALSPKARKVQAEKAIQKRWGKGSRAKRK